MTVAAPHKRAARGLGWKRDLPDIRDRLHAVAPALGKPLPHRVSLRDGFGPVFDQGALGSCTANAIAAQLAFVMAKEGAPWAALSRLFLYYGERDIEGTVDSDSGAFLRDGMKVASRLGAPPEGLWPYLPDEFADKPSPDAYAEALHTRATSYHRLALPARNRQRDVRGLMAELAAGFPFVFGFSVYTSFQSEAVARTGVVPMPRTSEDLEGGHAVCACGYDQDREMFEVRNSWNSSWGDEGYFWMPFAYLQDRDLSADFWTVKSVTKANTSDALTS